MAVKFVNLIPHELKIKKGDEIISIPPSGTVARVATIEKEIGDVDGIPVVVREFGDPEGIPAPEADTIYIVSALVASAVKGRSDVVAPDTGATAVRDEKGHIQYVTRLVSAG